MYNYHVQNQWGGTSAPWNEGGSWVLGYRNNQALVDIAIYSEDGGKTFNGTITYQGEGPIGFRATQICGNSYSVENQWGGDSAPWHPGGWWLIGARDGQPCVSLVVSSSDNGTTLFGEMTYLGEGPIGFKATATLHQHVCTYVQWGGTSAPWHNNGVMILSSRQNQAILDINIASEDYGQTFSGTVVYEGEGPIGFRAQLVCGNTYSVENQWGGDSAPWHDAGQWVIGTRENQRCVGLTLNGNPLVGEMTYAGEGPIGFKSAYEG